MGDFRIESLSDISSHGRTPVLLDGPDELFGSRKICRHVVEKYGVYGYQFLLGKDPLARVSVEQWIQSEEHRFDPPSSALVFHLAYKIETDVEKVTNSEKTLVKVLNLYEQRLGESDFLAGNYFTLADLYHLPNTYYLESSVEYGYLFKDRKNVSRWWKKISERNSWKKVVKKFEEEGLQFDVPVSNSETDQSFSSQRKNGIKIGPFGVSEISSKTETALSKQKKDDEAVQSKFKVTKEETSTVDKKESGVNKGGQRDDATGPKDDNKENIETNPSETGIKAESTDRSSEDKKETPKVDDREKSGKTDEMKERVAKNPASEDKKETPGPAGQNKPSSIDKSKLVLTNERKEGYANKPATEGEKEGPKPDDRDKASLGDKDKSGKTNEIKERYANKTDTNDKDRTSSDDSRKTGITEERNKIDANKPASEDREVIPKADDKDKASSGDKVKPAIIKERDANTKDAVGEKIDENKEHKTNDADTEGKKDGFKSDDRDKYSSGNEEKREVNKKNDNHGAIGSHNQVKRGLVPNDGKDKTSPGGNSNPNSKDEMKKTN